MEGSILILLQGHDGGPSRNDEDAVGDECNFDFGYDEYQKESLDRHWKVMTMKFRLEEEAYDFYNKFAKNMDSALGGTNGNTRRVLTHLCA